MVVMSKHEYRGRRSGSGKLSRTTYRKRADHDKTRAQVTRCTYSSKAFTKKEAN
jgi:hypothetical protein